MSLRNRKRNLQDTLEQTNRHTAPSQTTEVEGISEEVVSICIDKIHKYKSKVSIIVEVNY